MAGLRGKAHRNRTGKFDPDGPVRAAAQLQGGEEARRYRRLLAEMNVSGAEVVRLGLQALDEQRQQQRSKATPTRTREAAA